MKRCNGTAVRQTLVSGLRLCAECAPLMPELGETVAIVPPSGQCDLPVMFKEDRIVCYALIAERLRTGEDEDEGEDNSE
jgi:hypothetical protein